MNQDPTPEDVASALTLSEWGEGRDIQFLGVNPDGAAALLRWLAGRCVPRGLQECPPVGEYIPRDVPSACAAILRGQMVEGVFERGPPPLQRLFFSWVPDAYEPWNRMELSFEPSDVDLHGGLGSFLALLEEVAHECRATDYRVRGDGLIYSGKDVPHLLQLDSG